jgi:hypothetical protein
VTNKEAGELITVKEHTVHTGLVDQILDYLKLSNEDCEECQECKEDTVCKNKLSAANRRIKTLEAALKECGGDDQKYGDIKGTGLTWKPIAEKDGKLIVIGKRNIKRLDVRLLSMDKTLIEKAKYSGHANGYRANYRFKKPGRDYQSPLILSVGTKLYLIKDPSERRE